MQMTARGEKTKLVTTLSRYKKDSSQQSKRGSVTLRTHMGTASWSAIILWEPHSKPPNSCLFCDSMLTGATLRPEFKLTRYSGTLFKDGMKKKPESIKVQGQITSTLLGEAWHSLATTQPTYLQTSHRATWKGTSSTHYILKLTGSFSLLYLKSKPKKKCTPILLCLNTQIIFPFSIITRTHYTKISLYYQAQLLKWGSPPLNSRLLQT